MEPTTTTARPKVDRHRCNYGRHTSRTTATKQLAWKTDIPGLGIDSTWIVSDPICDGCAPDYVAEGQRVGARTVIAVMELPL